MLGNIQEYRYVEWKKIIIVVFTRMSTSGLLADCFNLFMPLYFKPIIILVSELSSVFVTIILSQIPQSLK